MRHINSNPHTKKKAVPEAWLAATAQATAFVIEVSGRRDLACQVAPGFAADAGTAQYTPHLRLIEVDTNCMLPGVRADTVDLNDELFSARHPLLKGALIHEAAHRRYTRWLGKDLLLLDDFTMPMIDVLTMLEESRIEKRMARRMPAMAAKYLPAIIFDLVGKDFTISDSPYGAAASAALIMARVDAGTLTEKQAKPFRAAILTVLDEETLNLLRRCWLVYQALPFHSGAELPVASMREVARAWLEALGIDPDAGNEGMQLAAAGGGAGEAGEAGGGIAEAIGEAAAAAAHDEAMEAASEVGEIKGKRAAEERVEDKARHEAGKAAAEQAFAEGTPGGHGYGEGGYSRVSLRAPEPAEVGAAGIFAKQLERVIYTDRRSIKVNSDVPGGRLRGRAAMAADAAAAQGMMPDAKMWRKRKVAVTDEPTIRLGLAVDISGSMAAAEQPLGSCAYILGNGVTRADGVFASVVFGEQIHGVIKPGQKIDRVPVVAAEDGYEAFRDAFLALDSMLSLLDGDGLKVLVLASDGCFVSPDHATYADVAMRMCEKRGVLVLHLDFNGDLEPGNPNGARHNSRHGNKTAPIRIVRGTQPQEVAKIIGARLIEEVKKLNQKRVAA